MVMTQLHQTPRPSGASEAEPVVGSVHASSTSGRIGMVGRSGSHWHFWKGHAVASPVPLWRLQDSHETSIAEI